VKIVDWLAQQVDEVHVISPTYRFQATWDPVRGQVDAFFDDPQSYLKGLELIIKREIQDEEHEDGIRLQHKRLIIFDDVSFEKSMNEGSKGFFSGLAYNAVHWNISLLVIAHRMSNISAGMRENCEYLTLFNTNSNEEVEELSKHFSAGLNKKSFLGLFKKTIWDNIQTGEDRYPFLFFDYNEGGLIYYKMQERLIVND
jgi:hypothetical protein